MSVNSLWHTDAMWRQRSRLTLVQTMAPSFNLHRYWLITSRSRVVVVSATVTCWLYPTILKVYLRVKCHSPENNSTICSWSNHMLTSTNGNIFRVTGPLCGEFTGHRWGEFPSKRTVARSFDVLFDLHRNKRLSEQSWRRCFATLSRSLWHHCNGKSAVEIKVHNQNQSNIPQGDNNSSHRVTYICVSKLSINCSDNGLGPGWHQANIWTSARILLIRTRGTNSSLKLQSLAKFIQCIWICRLRNGVYFISASMS